MCAARSVAARDNLDDLARAAVGGGRRLAGVSRLAGGSKKGAYRLAFDDGFTAVAYLWAGNENYWPVGGDPADPLSGASGVSLFEAAHRELQAAGVRTPRVYLIDRSGRRYPADVAVVEDVPGGSLKTLLDRDPQAAAFPLRRLAEALAAMHSRQSRRYGKVALVRDGGTASGSSCEQVVLDRARTDLAEAHGATCGSGLSSPGLSPSWTNWPPRCDPAASTGSSTASSDPSTCSWTGTGPWSSSISRG
jgi:hypothetical protein